MRTTLSRILLALYALNIALSWLHFAVVPHTIDAAGEVGHAHHYEHHHDESSCGAPDHALAAAPHHHHDHHHAGHCRVIEFYSQQTVVVASTNAGALDLSAEAMNRSPISRDIVLTDLFHIAPKQSPPLSA